ncbi:MAG: exonuclease SbcCD subunit D C-terminal domain-containing protein [Planctomycetaceae bacterium]|nr:exonuclease SbcCD subunit D C-terminal domain-containing protein [Planctomycetaceae bacterium]
MRILHTSDWHLGRTLCKRNRHDEFEAFLTWLGNVILEKQVDAVLVAGDVFDTTTPGNRAQEQYYRFLCRIALSSCRHLVVIAGNHDSPSFLNAPKELLQSLNIHIVGCITENIADEVLVLKNGDGEPELIVGAVPYLRDRDIRNVEQCESAGDKEIKLLEGIRRHYDEVCRLAEQKRLECGNDVCDNIPVVLMGHLFTSGGQLSDDRLSGDPLSGDDGVRELYVGTLAQVDATFFSDKMFFGKMDYLALGHLHLPQMVAGSDAMRYCGSPLAMSFKEARRKKSVCLVDFEGKTPSPTLLDVPVFQRLDRVSGDIETIFSGIDKWMGENVSIWVEIVYDGGEIIPDLREKLENRVTGTSVEILRIINNRITGQALEQTGECETLEQLDALEVFQRCLTRYQVSEHEKPALVQAYQEIIKDVLEDDCRSNA